MAEEEEKQLQAQQSLIQIMFKEPGSVIYDLRAQQVTPGQFLAIAEILRMMGEAGFAQEQAQRICEAQAHKIAIPNVSDIDPRSLM